MSRPWLIWSVFALCLAVVLSALGWMTVQALQRDQIEAERRHQEAQALVQGEYDDRVNRALWLMDSLLAGEIARESAWPPLAYQSHVRDATSPGTLMLSPLATYRSPLVKLHFQIGPDGLLSCPQDCEEVRALPTDEANSTATFASLVEDRLSRLRSELPRERLLAALPLDTVAMPTSVRSPQFVCNPDWQLANANEPAGQQLEQRFQPAQPQGGQQGGQQGQQPVPQMDQQQAAANRSPNSYSQLADTRNRRNLELRQQGYDNFVQNTTLQRRVQANQFLPQNGDPFGGNGAIYPIERSVGPPATSTGDPPEPNEVTLPPKPSLPPGVKSTLAGPPVKGKPSGKDNPPVKGRPPIKGQRDPFGEAVPQPGGKDRIPDVPEPPVLLPRLEDIREGVSKALWLDDKLLLARRVSIDGVDFVQGCWLDWDYITRWLRQEVTTDDLSEFELVPVRDALATTDGRVLAMLPARLQVPAAPQIAWSMPPVRTSLYVAWGCVLLAAVAVAVLLWGVLLLSERRASFVSAVTHELRTPLTTFQMYSEMLSEGMVADEATQGQYLRTLSREASRLSHLVENVLSYARLERGRPGGKPTRLEIEPLLERVKERLDQRAHEVDMQIVVEVTPTGSPLTVHANASSVEQILVNLVDNACKYARGAEDRRLHLSATREASEVILRVRDHGPGIDPAEARRLFKAFHKSASDAATSAPGVGLGLALSRRLAADMGGTLELDRSVSDGACFLLRLPQCPTT